MLEHIPFHPINIVIDLVFYTDKQKSESDIRMVNKQGVNERNMNLL